MKKIDNSQEFKHLVIYLSTTCQEPGPHNFQKVIYGQKQFQFNVCDYFEKDLQEDKSHLKNNFSEMEMNNLMKSRDLKEKPILYLSFYH